MDWLETGWVNHFDTQTKSIEDLKESVLYEFKTKARNSVGESEESDTTDARAQPGIGVYYMEFVRVVYSLRSWRSQSMRRTVFTGAILYGC